MFEVMGIELEFDGVGVNKVWNWVCPLGCSVFGIKHGYKVLDFHLYINSRWFRCVHDMPINSGFMIMDELGIFLIKYVYLA